jgi:predicted solute-binding protein
MLAMSDAALIIGDPALRIDPEMPDSSGDSRYVYDLGAEWVGMTGLPMVFAVWAGRKGAVTPEVSEAFRESCRYGREHMEEIVAHESGDRNFPVELVREYLSRHIVHELGAKDYEGMELYLSYARQLDRGVEYRMAERGSPTAV